jgi:hypothetical protein
MPVEAGELAAPASSSDDAVTEAPPAPAPAAPAPAPPAPTPDANSNK